MSVNDTAALDLVADEVRPVRDLRVSNNLLGDREALDLEYETYGYLFFRDVLDRASVDAARHRMASVLAKAGVVVEGSDPPVWNGKPFAGLPEESPEFRGISAIIFDAPANNALFEQILGEPVCQVPIVQYRSYPPNKPAGGVHQDGFHSPGVTGYRPIWVPLMPIDREVGGLTLAEASNHSGFFHNLAKPPYFPVARGVIPDEAWVTTDYCVGDLLVVHPHTPHTGLANRSDRFRLSIDTRVQSARTPSVVVGDVAALSTDSVTLSLNSGEQLVLSIDSDSYIRTGERPQERLTQDQMMQVTAIGQRLIAARNGDRAVMLRRASEG
jgi:ectoine hydroxylase-related dioxygenase (phytanoyl-CoA dioxygenase family)